MDYREALKNGLLEYDIPDSVANDPDAMEDWRDTMNDVSRTVSRLIQFGIPESDATELLPRAMIWPLEGKYE